MRKILIVILPLLLNVYAIYYKPQPEEIKDNIYPINNPKISSGFGQRKGKFHWGIDFAAPQGTPVIAPIDMKIYKTGRNENHGLYIIGKDDDGFYYLFAHLSKLSYNESKEVRQGEIIAFVGNTGLSFGPHLHYEISFNGVNFNPTNFTKKNFRIKNILDDFL